MVNSLGLLEVKGLTASIEACDAMLKAAQVRVVNRQITNPGLVTLVIDGDLAACRAALDAGAAAASRIGEVISRKEIGRPDKDTEWLVLSLIGQDNRMMIDTTVVEAQPPLVKSIAAGEALKEEAKEVVTSHQLTTASLLLWISDSTQGCNISELSSYFAIEPAKIKLLLEPLVKSGKLHKRGSRYLVKAKESK